MFGLSERRRFNLEIGLRSVVSSARGVWERPALCPRQPVDIFIALVDHFEPQVGSPAQAIARERMDDWLRSYPKIAGKHRDAEGRHPAHSFFYPWDEYDEWEFTRLAELCAAGWGEVDLHLHHRDDTDASLRRKLREAVTEYARHGMLARWPDGRPAWGFIHGDWALDNSRNDCGRNYCGVNNELTVLGDEGCYADFTFPAWQHTAQPRQLNSIYYAVDDPEAAKSYDRGEEARVGRSGSPGLLLIQGPLVPCVQRAGRGRRLAMDDGDLAACRRYEPARLDRWVRQGVHVRGRADQVYVKLHCHGADDKNRIALLGEDLDALFTDAETRYNDGTRYRLHYVTAREMFNLVKAAEAGWTGDIAAARDFCLPRVHARTPALV